MCDKKDDKKIEVAVNQWFELLLAHIQHKQVVQNATENVVSERKKYAKSVNQRN